MPAKSVAVAYRRAVFEWLGRLTTFDACEDVEFNHRIDQAGLRCFFTPEVAVHYAPRHPSGLFRQLVRYGRGRVRLWRKHRDTFTLGLVPPTLLMAGLIVGLPLSFLSVWFAFAYIAAIAIYAAILLTTSTVIAVRQRRFGLCYLLRLCSSQFILPRGRGYFGSFSGRRGELLDNERKSTPNFETERHRER